MKSEEKILLRIYEKLYAFFGPQHWWPADSPFEVIVGAILTQNTNWGNVRKAINNIKADGKLDIKSLLKLPHDHLALLIKPSGYFNIKAKRLKNFLEFMDKEFGGSLSTMKKAQWPSLRRKILTVNGAGPETADSILCYALAKPVFVVDAYTRRILYRHGFVPWQASYEVLQNVFMSHLRPNVCFYNEFHALLVRLGNEFCRPVPLCGECPLRQVRYSFTKRCPRCYRFSNGREKKRHSCPL
jgi:endonuclease III related protein